MFFSATPAPAAAAAAVLSVLLCLSAPSFGSITTTRVLLLHARLPAFNPLHYTSFYTSVERERTREMEASELVRCGAVPRRGAIPMRLELMGG